MRPKTSQEKSTAAKTLIVLRRFEGAPYTWHGSSDQGVPDLLRYYPPAGDISPRTQDDWMLKGFDSLGMLYLASNGATPVDVDSLGRFGKAVEVDFSNIAVEELAEENDDPNAIRLLKARALMAQLKPLDIIQMGERIWIVLDRSELIESRYFSKFDGKVQISSLLDTGFGLLQKGVFVKNPFEELEDPLAKTFFIRRYANTSSLLTDQLTEGEGGGEDSEESEGTESDEGGGAADPEPEENPTEAETETSAES